MTPVSDVEVSEAPARTYEGGWASRLTACFEADPLDDEDDDEGV